MRHDVGQRQPDGILVASEIEAAEPENVALTITMSFAVNCCKEGNLLVNFHRQRLVENAREGERW